MDRSGLLLRVMEDLRARVAHPDDEYGMLRAAALVRQLLLDSPSLMDVVNKPYRLKIRFAVNRVVDEVPPGSYWAVLDGLSPDIATSGYTVDIMDRRHFIQVQTLKMPGPNGTIRATVKDLIRVAAHVEGGVHVGDFESERERLLATTLKLNINGRDVTYAAKTMRAIGTITIRALVPLEEAVRTTANRSE